MPNEDSSLNAGVLPDGHGAFMTFNIAPAKVRDPPTIALSKDGVNFSSCVVVQTSTRLAGSMSACKPQQWENRSATPCYPAGPVPSRPRLPLGEALSTDGITPVARSHVLSIGPGATYAPCPWHPALAGEMAGSQEPSNSGPKHQRDTQKQPALSTQPALSGSRAQ